MRPGDNSRYNRHEPRGSTPTSDPVHDRTRTETPLLVESSARLIDGEQLSEAFVSQIGDNESLEDE